MKHDKNLALHLKEVYPPGTVIECIEMTDELTPIPPGTRGVVRDTDGLGVIYMLWDTGSTLSLLYAVDHYKIVPKGV